MFIAIFATSVIANIILAVLFSHANIRHGVERAHRLSAMEALATRARHADRWHDADGVWDRRDAAEHRSRIVVR